MLIEKSRQLQIALILLLGAGDNVAITLPARVAIPTQAFTAPRTFSLLFDKTMAGKAASYIEAIKLIAAKNNISHRYISKRVKINFRC